MRWFNWLAAIWLVGYLLSAIFMGAWALFDAMTEPTDEQIHYFLATSLKREDAFLAWEPLTNLNLRHEGDRRYEGTATSPDGTIFIVKAELREDGLEYATKSDKEGRQGWLRSPRFLERHSWSKPWLHLSALGVGIFGVVWPIAGLLRLRERFRLWVEVVLYVSAVGNLLLVAYQWNCLLELFK
jgi:hypothetical protein